MTSAVCPNCGASIRFRWSSAVQTTCEYCRSILVRHDLDLLRVGEVGDVPHDASPLQIGTEGLYENKSFEVVGRIVYTYEHGGWNEWHLAFNDSSSGWLSDAQLEYAVSFLFQPDTSIPSLADVPRGKSFTWDGRTYEITTVTRAHYAGVEGELPFEYWDKAEVLFADLRSEDGRFATIDFTEQPPLVFTGEFVPFDSLHLKNLRQFEGWS